MGMGECVAYEPRTEHLKPRTDLSFKQKEGVRLNGEGSFFRILDIHKKSKSPKVQARYGDSYHRGKVVVRRNDLNETNDPNDLKSPSLLLDGESKGTSCLLCAIRILFP
jgi:hypothetical protein